MTEPITIGDAERRARLVARLFQPGDPAAIVADNVALHSTDPATVYLTLRAREPDLTRDDIDRALYDERSIVRHLGMRRTLFVVPAELVPVVHAACTVDVHARERKRLVKLIEDSDLDSGPDADAWLADLEARVLDALDRIGPALANDLRDEVPELQQRLVVAGQKVDAGLTTFVLSRLAMSGRIARGRPRGSWVSGQYHWHLTDDWLGGPLPELDRPDAQAQLAEAWLARFGPATVDDLQWWAGWNKTQTRAALAAIDARPVRLEDGVEAFVTADDAPVAIDDTAVRFLPSLDGVPMGWKHRGFYLSDEIRGPLFDRWGNVGHTVWRGGEIVGGWGQTPDGTVRFRLLGDMDDAVTEAAHAEAAALTDWLDGQVVSPRFPTPLQRELATA